MNKHSSNNEIMLELPKAYATFTTAARGTPTETPLRSEPQSAAELCQLQLTHLRRGTGRSFWLLVVGRWLLAVGYWLWCTLPFVLRLGIYQNSNFRSVYAWSERRRRPPEPLQTPPPIKLHCCVWQAAYFLLTSQNRLFMMIIAGAVES